MEHFNFEKSEIDPPTPPRDTPEKGKRPHLLLLVLGVLLSPIFIALFAIYHMIPVAIALFGLLAFLALPPLFFVWVFDLTGAETWAGVWVLLVLVAYATAKDKGML